MDETIPQSPDLVSELNVPQRFEAVDEWASAASQVAQTTEDPHALEIARFIGARTTLGVPMPAGGVHYFFRQRPELPVSEYAFLAPLTEADTERLPESDFRRQMAEGKTQLAAQYREGSRAIYLPPSNFGQLGKGVLLQHEATHAWLDLNGLVYRNVENSHWFEEAEVYKFEFGLLEKLGGEPYSDLVGRVSKTISGTEDNPDMLLPSYRYTEQDRGVIAKGLQTANDQEIDFWLGVVNTNAFWEYFKENFDNPDVELMQMMKGMYADESLSPA